MRMNRRSELGRATLALLFLVALGALLPQCLLMPEEDFVGEMIPNVRPVVRITGGVLKDSLNTDVSAHFYWYGADDDGLIRYFEWAIDDTISEEAWTRTTEYDENIFFRATTAAGQDSFSDWHTFFIRSVDDHGIRSAPDMRYFNSRTVAPTSELVNPEPEYQATWASTLRFAWIGEDLDAEAADQLPEWFEIKLVETGSTAPWDDNEAMRRLIDQLPNLLLGVTANEYPDSSESEFLEQARRAWERHPGTVDYRWVTLKNSRTHVFAVRAIDEAGAREPRFQRLVNWVDFKPEDAHIAVRITEPALGAESFTQPVFAEPWEVTVAPGQVFRFRWVGDASESGTEAGPCNYGFDIPDPSDPAEPFRATDGMGGWIGWATRTQLAQPISFDDAGATHYFYLKMRDISDNPDTETQCIVKINVASFDMSRRFLVVDDCRLQPRDRAGNYPSDETSDQWRYDPESNPPSGVLGGLEEFLPEGENVGDYYVFGAGDVNPGADIRDDFLDTIGRYQTLLWDSSHGAGYQTGFKDAAEEMYLSRYVGVGGNALLIIDQGPVSAVTMDFPNNSRNAKEHNEDESAIDDPWSIYSFLYVQLHLRGPVFKPAGTSDALRARKSMIRAHAVNPLYPDMPFDFSRWDFGNYTESAIQSYEVLYPHQGEAGLVPWYEREDGLEVLYTTETWRARQNISDRPVAWRTFTTDEDRAIGIERGRLVCFAFHPYYFEESSVQGAMTLALNWLVTGVEY